MTYSANGDVHIMIDGIDQLGTCSIDTKQEDFFGKLSPSKEDILIGRCKSTDHFSVALMADIGQVRLIPTLLLCDKLRRVSRRKIL